MVTLTSALSYGEVFVVFDDMYSITDDHTSNTEWFQLLQEDFKQEENGQWGTECLHWYCMSFEEIVNGVGLKLHYKCRVGEEWSVGYVCDNPVYFGRKEIFSEVMLVSLE